MTVTQPDVESSEVKITRSERMQSPQLRAYIALAVGVVCIGFSAIFTKWAAAPVDGSEPMTGGVSAFYRMAIATVALLVPYALYSARRYTTRERREKQTRQMMMRVFWVTAIAGLFFALDLALWNTSLLFTSAANATLLGNTSTLWVSLGAMVIFGVSLKKQFWLGMLLALVGAAVIVGPDLYMHPDLGWGDLMAVGSSLFYAGYLLATGRVRKHIGTLPFMWLSSAVGTLFLLVYVLALRETLWGFSANQWLALLGLGLISHVAGWLAINYALGHLPAPLTAVSLLSQPVLTAILAVPLLGEVLSYYQIGGGLLVLVGIYIVNRRKARPVGQAA